MPAREPSDPVLAWLLEGDPAIVFQTLRDLTDAPRLRVEFAQREIALEGWGARLLQAQGADGQWASGLYNPKWTSTTYTMLLLRDLGLAPGTTQVDCACALLLDRGLTQDGGISYGFGRSETCVTGIILSVLSHFRFADRRLDVIAEHLLEQQMADGGWNCRRWQGASHSSVHTTINALEGLHLYRQHRGERNRRRSARLQVAERRGREFLLAHRLFRSHRTGAIIKSAFLKLAFPARWHYDILRALDYFQAVQAARDDRLEEAIDLLRQKQQPDGRWRLEQVHRGQTHFALERQGAASRWNTLRASRVLHWWNAA
jgi:hypothetical protein